MINTEYIRSLNANYERMALGEKPEEKRYQYCMISRGGIKGLLPCSLRYIDGNAYLYYDITSRQNIAQLFDKKVINRQWLTDFLWSMRRVRQEMSRFLLEESNIVWFPNHIYQDLEKNDFYFIYIRFLYKGIIIKHNKTEPTYTKTSLFLCEKRRFFMARTEKGVVTTI